jgi:AMME syndrome candidate gene 1 protein
MATPAHCAYCFESLAASFEKRKPLPLSKVRTLWETYHKTDDDDDEEEVEAGAAANDNKILDFRPAAISRLAGANSASSSVSSSAPSASSSTPSLNTIASSATSSSSSAKSSLLSVVKRLSGRASDTGHTATTKEEIEQEFPLFVTYETRRFSGRKDLRGCIGTFEPHELTDGLRTYALTS